MKHLIFKFASTHDTNFNSRKCTGLFSFGYLPFKKRKMILTTIHSVPGREISEILGIARGSTVRTRNVGRDIMATLKNLVGGEIEEYTKLQAHAREEAIQRMTDDARRLGADAVVGISITTAMVARGAAEIMAYGTAVKLK
jgi:uncharacterized protein YbjQ (UPF0145 family)